MNKVCSCYIQFLHKHEMHALQDAKHADGYIKNFMNCLHFSEYLYKTFPENDVALSNYGLLYYSVLNETGLILFNAARKLEDRELENEMNILRRTSSIKARDLHLALLSRRPEDVNARQRLKKMTEM